MIRGTYTFLLAQTQPIYVQQDIILDIFSLYYIYENQGTESVGFCRYHITDTHNAQFLSCPLVQSKAGIKDIGGKRLSSALF